MSSDPNEELAWERLKDVQREIELRRVTAPEADVEALYQAQLLVERARGLVRAIRARMRPAI